MSSPETNGIHQRSIQEERADKIQVQILGAGCDVGRSCVFLRLSHRNILLDCGAHPGYADSRRFPDFGAIQGGVDALDAVLITHFHFDHSAALPLLTEKLNCSAPVYMTEPTRELARLMLHDVVKTSAGRKQYCPYNEADVDRCLSRVFILPRGPLTVGRGNDIQVFSHYAGHVIGAVMLEIHVGGHSIVYTGDYSLKADRHLYEAAVPLGTSPELLITEATYCASARRESRWKMEQEVVSAIMETVDAGGKVLVPISAFGRMQAVCGALDAHADSRLHGTPLYVSHGLAERAHEIYKQFREWMVSNGCTQCGRKRRFANACTHRALDRVKCFRREDWRLVHTRGPMVLFATPGSLTTGLSLEVLRVWGPDRRNLIVVPGFSLDNTLSGDNISGTNGVQCRVVNFRFGSHADARGIVRTCHAIRPKAVMLVHGDGEKVKRFAESMHKQLKLPCFAPENGEIIVLNERGAEGGKPDENTPAWVKEDGAVAAEIAKDLVGPWKDALQAHCELTAKAVI